MRDLLLLARFGDQRTGQEGSQRDRIAEGLREERDGEADADARDERRLAAVEPADGTHRPGHEKKADRDQSDEEPHQSSDRRRQRPGGESAPRRDAREDGDQQDGDQVFCDQDAEAELAQLPRDPLLLEGLRDDRGARNGDDGAREQALEARPPEEAADRESQPDHEAGLEQGGEPGRRPDFREPAETELEPERKHQEDDAQLRERLHDDRVGHEGDRHVGPDDQPGEDVAQHDRRPARLTAGRLTAALAAAVLLALALYAGTFVISYEDLFRAEDPLVRNDVARLAPARVERVDTVREVDQLRAVLREASQRGLKASI